MAACCLHLVAWPQADAARLYPARTLIDLDSMNETERERLAAAHKSAWERCNGADKSYHPPAVAHFYGFWADESEEGAGDEWFVSSMPKCRRLQVMLLR